MKTPRCAGRFFKARMLSDSGLLLLRAELVARRPLIRFIRLLGSRSRTVLLLGWFLMLWLLHWSGAFDLRLRLRARLWGAFNCTRLRTRCRLIISLRPRTVISPRS